MRLREFTSPIKQEGLRDPKDNPCWDGYKPVGTKKKNGKTVPNCVPENADVELAIKEHIRLNIPFSECLFRPGSDAFYEFYQTAKRMFAEGKLDVDWQDAELLGTNIGEFIMVEGERVPLDVPIEEEVELKEDFYWENDWDSEQFRNFSSLVKYNEGIFKSNKQAKFLLNKLKNRLRSDADSLKNFFGIDANSNEKAILITGYAQWSRYGAKGTRPVTWAFVLDDYGVTKKYKIKYRGDMRKGTSPDPSKTQLEWSRNESAAKPLIQKLKDEEKEQAKAVAATPQGKHIGNIGDRTNFEGTVEMSFGPKYGAFGEYYINKIRTSLGDAILNFGNAMGNKGDKIKFKATVAKHDTDSRSGEPITLVKRVKMSASESKQGVAEAEYQGKDVDLNSPKRGGPKKFYVYVKNPKTGNVKKVTWGDTTGLKIKSGDPDRVRSFVARHKCKQANDKTTARYWACRTPRYKSLGVKGGAWW